MAPPDLPSRPKGYPQSDVQEGAPELVKCSKSPEGSQPGANDNPAASSQSLEATSRSNHWIGKAGERDWKTPPQRACKGPPEGSQPSPKDLQKGPRKGSLEIGPEKGVHHPCDPRPEGPQTLQIPRFFQFGHLGRHSRVWGLPAPILGPIFGVPGCSRLNVDIYPTCPHLS